MGVDQKETRVGGEVWRSTIGEIQRVGMMSVGDVGMRAMLQGFASPTCRKMSSKRSSIMLSLPSSTSTVLTKNFLHLSRASVMIPQESLRGRLVMVHQHRIPSFYTFISCTFFLLLFSIATY